MAKLSLQTPSDRAKPYPEFPLFRHQNGQWCKKVRGRLHYFGTDADKALAKWLDERDALLAGRVPRPKTHSLTVRDLCNRFLTSKKLKRDAGELSDRTFSEYHGVAATVVSAFGRDRVVDDLAGTDFEQLRAQFSGLSLVTVSKRVTICKRRPRNGSSALLMKGLHFSSKLAEKPR